MECSHDEAIRVVVEVKDGYKYYHRDDYGSHIVVTNELWGATRFNDYNAAERALKLAISIGYNSSYVEKQTVGTKFEKIEE